MDLASNAITAVVILGAVVLGGWLTVRSQDRHWQRDHARQWRDVRLKAYGDFLTAYRQYVAFALEEESKIKAIAHPRRQGELMPFFDKNGRAYREQLEAAKTAAKLVSADRDLGIAMHELLFRCRQVAAARAEHSATALPPELFDELWEAERGFFTVARRELGLPLISPTSQEQQVDSVLDD